jgi:hypothetical protein
MKYWIMTKCSGQYIKEIREFDDEDRVESFRRDLILAGHQIILLASENDLSEVLDFTTRTGTERSRSELDERLPIVLDPPDDFNT